MQIPHNVQARRFGFLLILIMTTAAALAQSNYGALRGIVSDVQGGTVAAASITLTSEATKITRTTSSNGSGEYVFNAVEPGRYMVTVTGNGFKTVDEKGVVIDSGDTIPLDLKLPIGVATESVDVNAVEAVVNNGTSYNGQLIDAQKLENLPNPGRNPFLFSKLDNNVTPVGDPRFVRFQDQSGSSTISIAGAPLSSNNYLIDGVPSPISPTAPSSFPPSKPSKRSRSRPTPTTQRSAAPPAACSTPPSNPAPTPSTACSRARPARPTGAPTSSSTT